MASESATTTDLRIDFPGGSGTADLEHISWEDWFAKFDEENLAFLYQQKVSGEDSTFFKLVAADRTW